MCLHPTRPRSSSGTATAAAAEPSCTSYASQTMRKAQSTAVANCAEFVVWL